MLEIEHIHTRMPVILEPERYEAWLDGSAQGADAKLILMDNQMDHLLQFHRVSRDVNKSRYDGTVTKKPLVNSL